MRPRLASGLLFTASLVLVGCSSSISGNPSGDDASATSAAAATSAAPAPAGPAKCVASQLTGSLLEGDAGAGQRYATLLVKNTSATPCTMFGYGGLGLYFMNGTPLPTDAQRVLDPKPSLVTVAPGETAKTNLHWGVVATGNEGNPCQPPPQQLRVIPPDDTKQVSIAWTFGPVCNKGRLDESAFHK